MKTLKHLAALCAALFLTTAAFGQTARMHLNGTLQNMHLWRGQQVADGGVLAADLNVGLLDDKLKVGLWGGTDFTGDYKEFDYYVSYSVAGFTVAVWDIFNYSPALPFSKDIFNYNKHSTGHFLDLSVAYDFDTKFEVPLRLYWATIFAGRDLNQAGRNRYSTYVNAEYSLFRDEHWIVDVGLGGTFAFNRDGADGGANFYGYDGIDQISLRATYKLKLGRFDMPVFAHAMWNPDQRAGYLQVGVNLFAF
ncbi:hypothetical protein B5G09_07690 [Alistipes sp. An54]|uniref:hypothetical protein n=1 Tax=Alistipes sp. An54 TaxID=1965645 RepID=UPI000B36CD47|nr:hypothetical protein [Alistipes sp. An54]OUN77269.1 hypothetical protein B5G09_07690 [Alistipes sp. An54]